MLTPIDIDNKEFARQIKGYNIDEVDIFLDQISDDLEILMKEKMELEEKLEKLEKSVDQYKAVETTLQDTLLIAQKTAEDVKNVAKKEAEQIITSAQELAQKAIEEMELNLDKEKEKFDKVKQDQKVYKAKMESILISQLELLSELDEDKEFAKLNETSVKTDINKEVEDSKTELEKKLKELEEAKEEVGLNNEEA